MIQPSKAEDPTIALELWTKLPQTFSKDLGGGIINRGSDGGVSGPFTCCKFFWVEHCRSCPLYNQPQVYKCPLIQAPGFASFVTLCLFFLLVHLIQPGCGVCWRLLQWVCSSSLAPPDLGSSHSQSFDSMKYLLKCRLLSFERNDIHEWA